MWYGGMHLIKINCKQKDLLIPHANYTVKFVLQYCFKS